MDVQEMKRLYVEEGKSLVNVGKEAGISAYFVRKALVGIGVRILPEGVGKGLPPVDHMDIRRLYEGGMSQGAIGERVGRCGSNIGQILRRQGVRGRSPQERFSGTYSVHTRKRVKQRHHARASVDGRIDEPAAIIEALTGRQIGTEHPIHHVNGDRQDNRPDNFVVCEDTAYHFLLHYRARALRESGNANYVKCEICLAWTPPGNPGLTRIRCNNPARRRFYHKACNREVGRKWKQKQRKNSNPESTKV